MTGIASEAQSLPGRSALHDALLEQGDRLKAETERLKAYLLERTLLEEKLNAIEAEYVEAGLTSSDLKERLVHLRKAQARVQRLRERVKFSDTASLSDVGAGLKSLSLLVDAYVRLSHEHSSVEQALESLRDQISKADTIIARENPIIERLGKGISFIQQLTTEVDPEKALSSFLCSTRREIGELFSTIHAPQEFSGVEIGTDGTLKALRKKGGCCCAVSELSSGQRSALGIALFLVMNRLATKAPRILIMDDPVAHVDDLNALAFFDCLREITADGSRQLFFATASGKAAALFQKKFDFMGGGFAVHRLSP